MTPRRPATRPTSLLRRRSLAFALEQPDAERADRLEPHVPRGLQVRRSEIAKHVAPLIPGK